jgi:hypothetical protein
MPLETIFTGEPEICRINSHRSFRVPRNIDDCISRRRASLLEEFRNLFYLEKQGDIYCCYFAFDYENKEENKKKLQEMNAKPIDDPEKIAFFSETLLPRSIVDTSYMKVPVSYNPLNHVRLVPIGNCFRIERYSKPAAHKDSVSVHSYGPRLRS